MTPEIVFAIPGDLATRTGGYAYDRHLIEALRRRGARVRHLELGSDYPAPSRETIARTSETFAALPDGTQILVDGLAFGAMPEIAAREGARLRLVALVHHPLGLESGLEPETASALIESERRALGHTAAVVVTSRATKRTLGADFGVPEAKIHVAEPGRAVAEAAVLAGDPPLIVSVGSLVHRKGHDILVDALARLADRPWRCRIVGEARDAAVAADLRARIAANGLGDRIALVTDAADAGAEMAGADIFALATRYEGYGMVFAEAMAHGLPIVGTRAGAVPDVVPREAGRLVPADDAAAFGDALAALLAEPALRRRLADGGREAAAALPTWDDTAAIVAALFAGRTE